MAAAVCAGSGDAGLGRDLGEREGPAASRGWNLGEIVKAADARAKNYAELNFHVLDSSIVIDGGE